MTWTVRGAPNALEALGKHLPAHGKVRQVCVCLPVEHPFSFFFSWFLYRYQRRGYALPPSLGWHPRAPHALPRQTPFRRLYLLLIFRPFTSLPTPPVSGIWRRAPVMVAHDADRDPQATNLAPLEKCDLTPRYWTQLFRPSRLRPHCRHISDRGLALVKVRSFHYDAFKCQGA